MATGSGERLAFRRMLKAIYDEMPRPAAEAVRSFAPGGRVPPQSGGTGTTQGAEPPLGNPPTDGYQLASTVAGVRSWAAPATGGGATVLDSVSGTAPIVAGPIVAKNQAISITPATTSAPGSLAAADKAKLDGVASGSQANVLEDVTLASATTAVAVTNGGAGGIVAKVKAITFTIANAIASGAAGLMTGADKAKLDGVAAGSQANVLESVSGTAPIVAGAVTAKNQAISITAATTAAPGSLSAADKTKLDSVTAGAGPTILDSISGTAPIVVGAVAAKNQAVSITPATTSAAGSLAAADKTKLDALLFGAAAELILSSTPTGAATGPGVGQYTRRAGGYQDVHLRSGSAATSVAMVESQGGTYFACNAYWDGTNWQRYDTGAPACAWLVGGLSLYAFTAPAGANPISFTVYTVVPADLARPATNGKVRNAYVAATDVASGLALSANTWTTITSLSFTQVAAGAQIGVEVSGNIIVGAAGLISVGSRLLVNGATPHMLGGNPSVPGGAFGNALSGAGGRKITGLAVATHTIAVQVIASAAATAYCRASTNPSFESLAIAVTEFAA